MIHFLFKYKIIRCIDYNGSKSGGKLLIIDRIVLPNHCKSSWFRSQVNLFDKEKFRISTQEDLYASFATPMEDYNPRINLPSSRISQCQFYLHAKKMREISILQCYRNEIHFTRNFARLSLKFSWHAYLLMVTQKY